ncbi:hypothetical protein D1AOALGA4SA_5382 [Olavius algarvensis Delta 1 endosymbiont]|nr:hypothetical protein D1AOALGA4SA_5382 [Olavius algarvensis Delta 1 endosymbiont]
MTISYWISDRYISRYTREGKYPGVKVTLYDFINFPVFVILIPALKMQRTPNDYRACA